MLHDDFTYFEPNISEEDFRAANKIRRRAYDICNLVGSVVVIIFVILLKNIVAVKFSDCLLIICTCTWNIFVRGFHLFYLGRICGMAYGTVTDMQSRSKVIKTYAEAEYDIYPWSENNYKYGQEKPMRARIKEFYYVNVSICNTDECLEHICCYKKDFDKMRKGTKAVIVKLNNGLIIAIPAA